MVTLEYVLFLAWRAENTTLINATKNIFVELN
jgi:hypothetical protein